MMLSFDVTDCSGFGAHDDGMSIGPTADETNAVQKCPLGHTGRAEHDVAARKLVNLVNTIEVLDPHFLSARFLVFLAKDELPLKISAHAPQGRQRQSRLQALRRNP